MPVQLTRPAVSGSGVGSTGGWISKSLGRCSLSRNLTSSESKKDCQESKPPAQQCHSAEGGLPVFLRCFLVRSLAPSIQPAPLLNETSLFDFRAAPLPVATCLITASFSGLVNDGEPSPLSKLLLHFPHPPNPTWLLIHTLTRFPLFLPSSSRFLTNFSVMESTYLTTTREGSAGSILQHPLQFPKKGDNGKK
jgi:hypothetical protein